MGLLPRVCAKLPHFGQIVKKMVKIRILAQNWTPPSDWPDPAITYYKCLRGFFPSRFIYITGFTKRPETTARTTASGRILGGIFAFWKNRQKNGQNPDFGPKLDPPRLARSGYHIL